MLNSTRRYADLGVKVLLIEDEEHIRQIVRRLLVQMGITLVYEAEDGQSGFKELVRVKPDFIICDIHMAGMDGLSFLKRIRALSHKSVSNLPILFLTADKQMDMQNEAALAGVSGYLIKPVSFNDLSRQVDRIMGN